MTANEEKALIIADTFKAQFSNVLFKYTIILTSPYTTGRGSFNF